MQAGYCEHDIASGRRVLYPDSIGKVLPANTTHHVPTYNCQLRSLQPRCSAFEEGRVPSSTGDFVDFEKANLISRFFFEKANLISRGPSPQTRGRLVVQASQVSALLILTAPASLEFYGVQSDHVNRRSCRHDQVQVSLLLLCARLLSFVTACDLADYLIAVFDTFCYLSWRL